MAAAFSHDGQRVLTASRNGTVSAWDISPEDRPTPDIVGLTHLLSGHRIEGTGAAVPLPAEELTGLWAELRTRYPADFAVTPAAVRQWREREIRESMKERNLAAAEFHYWWLVAELAPGKAK